MKGFVTIIISIGMWLLPCLGFAQTPEAFHGKSGPIHITSQQLEADYQTKTITFIGNVVAKQKDFILYADRLFLYLDKEGKDIETIRASGNVRIVQGKRRATCREALYHHLEGKLTLQGDPMVREGNSSVRGQSITYYINEQKSVTEGETGGRVTITIIPGEVNK